MKQREFETGAGHPAAVDDVRATPLEETSKLAKAAHSDPVQTPEDMWLGVQKTMGYSDKEMEIFKQQPRTKKIAGRLAGLSEASVIFEVKKSHGCIAGHKQGDYYVFPNGGSLDTKKNPGSPFPFFFPPMGRLIWVF